MELARTLADPTAGILMQLSSTANLASGLPAQMSSGLGGKSKGGSKPSSPLGAQGGLGRNGGSVKFAPY